MRFSELNNRKILEDLQIKKQLILQKGVSAVGSTPVNNANQLNTSMPLVVHLFYTHFIIQFFTYKTPSMLSVCHFQLMQVSSAPGSGGVIQQTTPEILSNTQASNIGRAAWVQANNQSFGFFISQDSLFGNNILPVLPRVPNTNNK